MNVFFETVYCQCSSWSSYPVDIACAITLKTLNNAPTQGNLIHLFLLWSILTRHFSGGQFDDCVIHISLNFANLKCQVVETRPYHLIYHAVGISNWQNWGHFRNTWVKHRQFDTHYFTYHAYYESYNTCNKSYFGSKMHWYTNNILITGLNLT